MQGFALRPMLMAMALAAAAGAPVMATTVAPPPERTASAPASPHVMPGQMPLAQKKAPPAAPGKLVDINRAGRKELMTLPGIGADEATRIIANRPYLTKTELVTKGVLPIGPFLSLKKQVVAMHYIKPASGRTAEPEKASPAAKAAKAP
jgi:hypothetical protein